MLLTLALCSSHILTSSVRPKYTRTAKGTPFVKDKRSTAIKRHIPCCLRKLNNHLSPTALRNLRINENGVTRVIFTVQLFLPRPLGAYCTVWQLYRDKTHETRSSIWWHDDTLVHEITGKLSSKIFTVCFQDLRLEKKYSLKKISTVTCLFLSTAMNHITMQKWPVGTTNTRKVLSRGQYKPGDGSLHIRRCRRIRLGTTIWTAKQE